MTNKLLSIENAKIGFRNFAGEPGRYNKDCKRSFCVFLQEDLAKDLIEDGWNVKYLTAKDEDESPSPYLQVRIQFGNFPPKIVLITSNGKTKMDEEDIGNLDWAEIENIDLIIRPYNWEVKGESGVSAYLKTMYVTLVEDDFEHKYKHIPDRSVNSGNRII